MQNKKNKLSIRPMHVLVTGATGFIGHHLCEELLKRGFAVTGIGLSKKPIAFSNDLVLKNLRMHYCDISNENDLLKTFSKIGTIDGVFHLAGQTYRRDLSNVHKYFRSNFQGTLNMLECCRASAVKRFVYSSSYAVYGLISGRYVPEYVPVNEFHICRPYDFYDASKYCTEQLCKFYHDRFDIGLSVLRYSKIYGPGLKEGVVYELINKALSNLPIKVNGDISSDFVYINDVVQATLASYNRVSKFEIYNIGSGEDSTLSELASNIVRITKSKSEILYSKQGKRAPGVSLDISKAKKELSYNPLSLEEGLRDYIKYMKHENEMIPNQINSQRESK